MKYLYLSLSTSLFLFGCQVTQQANNSELIADENIASPVEINQALLTDETIDVIHPVADVDMDLRI